MSTQDSFKTTEETWDTIAESFEKTRKKPWKECLEFIERLSSSAVVADLGCGNGRHLLPCAERCKQVFGLDISHNLLNLVQHKIHQQKLENVTLLHGNLISLPFQDNSLDAVLYIASLHNIEGREQRLCSLKEIKRVLKQDGTALISVWSRWQDKYRTYFLKQIVSHQGEFGDINIYWNKDSIHIPRFYHLYSRKEFIKDIKQSGLSIKRILMVKRHSKIYFDNYFLIVKLK